MEDYSKLLDLKKEEWDQYLDKITEPKQLYIIKDYFNEKMLIDGEKFFIKGNSIAGRRARIFAQKMKDVLQRYRNLIIETKKV